MTTDEGLHETAMFLGIFVDANFVRSPLAGLHWNKVRYVDFTYLKKYRLRLLRTSPKSTHKYGSCGARKKKHGRQC